MQRGEITRLAKRVGVTSAYMGMIMKRAKIPSPEKAKKLEEATGINRLAWLYPDEYPNRMIQAFRNERSKTATP